MIWAKGWYMIIYGDWRYAWSDIWSSCWPGMFASVSCSQRADYNWHIVPVLTAVWIKQFECQRRQVLKALSSTDLYDLYPSRIGGLIVWGLSKVAVCRGGSAFGFAGTIWNRGCDDSVTLFPKLLWVDCHTLSTMCSEFTLWGELIHKFTASAFFDCCRSSDSASWKMNSRL